MPSIQEIIAAEQKRLEQVLRAAYESGKADAKSEMLKVLGGETPNGVSPASSEEQPVSARKRAPRGLALRMITARLKDNAIYGMTVREILDSRMTSDEKMLAPSSIRAVLRKGAEDGTFEERNGKWYLASPETSDAVEMLS